MTDFPDLKIKALVNFPARVGDGIGIDVVKSHGLYTFNLAYDDFTPPVSGVTNPDDQNVLVWNVITGQYTLVPLAILGVDPGIAEAPDDLVQYGRQSLGWTPIDVTEAPDDLVQYGRQGLGWTPVKLATDYDTKAALHAATIHSSIKTVHVRGFATAGDRGAADYKWVASEPSHEGKEQSADGAWWEIAESRPTPEMFGALCEGDDEFGNPIGDPDDSIGINNAIDYLIDTQGGGCLTIGTQTRARIKNPIIIKDGITLLGFANASHQAVTGMNIKAIEDMAAMITSEDTGVVTHSVGIIGLSIDANKDNVNVDAAIRFAMLNSRIENCYIGNGTGIGIDCTYDFDDGLLLPIMWVNWIVGNHLTYFEEGFGILFRGSDSVMAHNYLTHCGYGVLIQGSGDVRFIANMVEVCTIAGLTIQSPIDGTGSFCTNNIIGNTFAICENGLVFLKGATGATSDVYGSVIGNFFHESVVRDIYVYPGMTNGRIGENDFSSNTPSDGHVSFGSTNCVGWTVDGSPGMVITGGAVDLKLKHGAWRSYTPTILSVVGSPTITTISAAYSIQGNICHFHGRCLISAIGSASNRMTISLPVPCISTALPAGAANGVNVTSGVFLGGSVNLDSGKASIAASAGSFPGTTGDTITFSGWYEIAT